MTIYKETKKYKIITLLKEVRWSKPELSRELWISISAVNQALSRWIKTVGTQKKYTDAFNRCFEVNYSYKELFSLVD